MFAQSILSKNEGKMQKSTEKMSSGYALNRAKDNPAGMAITNRMKAQLKSLDRATKNSKNAINVTQTADGTLAEIEEMLQRMNELSIQASNGLNGSLDRMAIQEEVMQLCSEIERVSRDTNYNTQTLLDGSQALKGYSSNPDKINVRSYNEQFSLGDYSVETDLATGRLTMTKSGNYVDIISQDITAYTKVDSTGAELITGYSTKVITRDGGEIIIDTKVDPPAETPSGTASADLQVHGIGGMKIQVGAEEDQEIQVVIPKISLLTLGLDDLSGSKVIDVRTEESATRSIDIVSKAIDIVSAARSKIGAYQNRLEKTISNLDVTTENLTSSYSTIKDLDMAEGMVEYTTLQVLIQAGTSMLAQANEQPQQALQLLQ